LTVRLVHGKEHIRASIIFFRVNFFSFTQGATMRFYVYLFFTILLILPHTALSREISDAQGRKLTIPETVTKVICSGSGCLRLLTYLQAQNMAVAVDDIEGRRRQFDARPYALANPGFKKLPIFGEFRGKDNPELILTLEEQPEVILKAVATSRGAAGLEPKKLQQKTGIPVVVLHYGNLAGQRKDLFNSLRIMGDVVGKRQRAEEVIAYFQQAIDDLHRRTADIPDEKKPSVYLGGVAYAGPHGFQSTEPTYPPFRFISARNLADGANAAVKDLNNTDIAKEKIVAWNPDILFLDLATLQLGDQAGGLHELKTDPAYQTLTAVQTGSIYGVLPYNWYNQNFDSILANAYFIGKLLYPDRFRDIDPRAKADEIYTFLVGKPLFDEMNSQFQDLAFAKVPVQ
jgi:iron complex transport system substrate-binding protein